MRRLLKVLGVLIILLLAAILILPLVFKDEIIARAKSEINRTVTAQVDFEDINISLFRSFPDFSLSIENTTVDGTGRFEGVRLASIEDFTVDLELFSVISGQQFQVEKIAVSNARLHVVIDTSGQANYDIVATSEADTSEADTAGTSDFKLTLKEYLLENVEVIYDDREGHIYAHLENINHSGRGDFTQEIVNLQTETEIDALSLRYEGINYLTQIKTVLNADFKYNQSNYQLDFGENELRLNELPLHFTGMIAIPDDAVKMDMAFEAPTSNLKNLLSLVPAVYLEGYEDMEASGDFLLEGSLAGTYDYEDTYPQYDFKMKVNQGSFQYPDLPVGVNEISIDARVFNETSALDGTVVQIPKASAVIAGSPVAARLHLSKPISNPVFDVYLKTDMDLANLAKVVPPQGFKYSGQLKADLALAGNMADIEAERYDQVKAEGNLRINQMKLQSDSLPFPIGISAMDMAFSPQKVALKTFESKLGRSDISANGSILNLMGYALKDQALKADFSLYSKLLDLNELSKTTSTGEAEAEQGEKSDTASALEVVRIPENLDIQLNTQVDKVIYDNLNINNLSGQVALSRGKAHLDNLVMNLLEGTLALSGSYNSKPAQPQVDLNFKIDQFGFKESFQQLASIRKLAPIMQSLTGVYSTSLQLASALNQDMSPDYGSIEASGTLTTRNVTAAPKVLQKLSNTLQNPDLSSLDISNLNLNYRIENGRVVVDPFKFSAGQVSATVDGYMGLDQSLDYTMDMEIPVKGIKAGSLLNKIGATDGGTVNMQVGIGGTASNPKITTSLGDVVGGVVDNLKEKAKEKVEEVKEEVNQKAQALIEDAEKKGDQLIAEAQKKGDALVAEAKKQAQNLRNEAEKKATKLEKEAEGNILKEKGAGIAAKKIRDEADDKANKLVSEAQKRADQLVNEAEKQKQQLVDEARQKAQLQ
ncbi:MAG: AsmA-like C-terminal region-containing protein [Owenweeksia sp.]|nr:AsmA-like C-terminal region-containing protein [Owenweeksia sp.]